MSDPESIALNAAYSEAMVELGEAKRQAVIEDLKNELYWARHTGPDAASMKRTQSAEDYWRPYQELYHRRRAAGRKPGPARMDVDNRIWTDGSWPPDYAKNMPGIKDRPSQRTLVKWLI